MERHPEAENSARSDGLDALRGVAIGLVLVYHLQQYIKNWWPETGGLSHGYPGLVMSYFWVGVDLFYVLSGFFISSSILKYKYWSPNDYFKRRLKRILPAYYISMILTLLLVESYLLNSWTGWANIGLHLVMLHQWQPWSMNTINGPYWTLGIEFAYYCVMLAVAPWWRGSRGWMVIISFWAISFIWRAGVFVGFPVADRFFWAVQIPGALDEFAMGMLAAYAHHRGWLSRLTARFVVARPLLFAAGTAIAGYSFLSYVALKIEYWSQPWYVLGSRTMLCFGFAVFLMAILGLSEKSLFFRIVRISGLPWLGKISYSIYLYHIPIVILFYRYGANILIFNKWVFVTAVLVSVLLVSWLSYRLVETRFHASA